MGRLEGVPAAVTVDDDAHDVPFGQQRLADDGVLIILQSTDLQIYTYLYMYMHNMYIHIMYIQINFYRNIYLRLGIALGPKLAQLSVALSKNSVNTLSAIWIHLENDI